MSFNPINGSIIIPRANVLRDFNYSSYYTLITEYDLVTLFTPGWLSGYNPDVLTYMKDGDFVRVCYDITDRWHSGQIECKASYNPSTNQFSLVPVSLIGFKAFGKLLGAETYNITSEVSFSPRGFTYMGLLPVNTSSSASAEASWNANSSYTVEVTDVSTGAIIWSFNLAGANMRYMSYGSFSPGAASSIKVAMTPTAPAGTSLDVYVFTTG